MILNLLKFLTHDDCSLWEASNRLMVMSDNEFIELAYMLRKIIRECDFNTETHEIMLRGYNIIYSDDYEIFVTLSKLISKKPFEDAEVAKAKVEEGIK